MTILLGIILALLIFSIIVFFHKLGHFSMAKRFWVKVDKSGAYILISVFVWYREVKGIFGHKKMLPTRIRSVKSGLLESGNKIIPRDGL